MPESLGLTLFFFLLLALSGAGLYGLYWFRQRKLTKFSADLMSDQQRLSFYLANEAKCEAALSAISAASISLKTAQTSVKSLEFFPSRAKDLKTQILELQKESAKLLAALSQFSESQSFFSEKEAPKVENSGGGGGGGAAKIQAAAQTAGVQFKALLAKIQSIEPGLNIKNLEDFNKLAPAKQDSLIAAATIRIAAENPPPSNNAKSVIVTAPPTK